MISSRFTLFLRLAIMLCWGFVCQAQPRLQIGYFELPPHLLAPGQGNSPAIQYFDEIAARMQRQAQYLHAPLPRLLQMLEQQQLDAILLLAKNAERQHRFVFPAVPWLVTGPALVVSANHTASIAALQQDPNFRMAVWQSGHHAAFTKTIKGTLLPLSGDRIAERGLQMLAQGKIDAFYCPDRHAVQYWLQQPGLPPLKLLPIPNESIEIYTVFSKQSAAALLGPYQRALLQQQQSHPYTF